MGADDINTRTGEPENKLTPRPPGWMAVVDRFSNGYVACADSLGGCEMNYWDSGEICMINLL